MLRFLLGRLSFAVLTLLIIIYLCFFGLTMARGTPLRPAVEQSAEKSIAYLARLAQGDLGRSFSITGLRSGMPVSEAISLTLPKSLGLLGFSLLIAAVLGVSLGIWAAHRRHTPVALLTTLSSLAGISLPSFFVAMLLQLGVIKAVRDLGIHLVPVGGFGWDRHIILPALVLAARPLAQLTQVTFIALSETLDQDYVRTAHSKGLRPSTVLSRHVMRNAAIPILTTLGTSLRFSLSSLPVVELFFGWPGIGSSLLRAIYKQDDDLTVALVLCLGLLFIVVNLALEGAYRLLDPRLREGERAARRERKGLWQSLSETIQDAVYLAAHNRVMDWLKGRAVGRPRAEEDPFRAVLRKRLEEGLALPSDVEAYRRERRQAWLRSTAANAPFLLGGLIVAGLLTVVILGPQLSPHNPYNTRGLEIVNGKLTVPPFAPSAVYPWGTDVLGRDIMSLVLTGAQRTLIMAAVVVLARMAVGFLLGALAGWLSGSLLDRAIMGLAEVIAAFPALLLAMVLILALGIRQGMSVFVVALCFVGWGEVMQFVRGQVMAIRPKAYIESAVAVGLRTPRILLSHVLPNLLPALIALAALEMSAVLMLLGELGFVGIFIGGGAFAELDVASAPYHYSDVPEWGALLSNVRLYSRSYPWTAFYPALAFFVAILGFNLFGEGLRRLAEGVGASFTRLINRYTLAAAALALVAVGWARDNVGPLPFYREQALAFDGERALVHVRYLASPELGGRRVGTPGIEAAADYIAQQFEAAGLQPAGEKSTYFYTRQYDLETLDSPPTLEVHDGGPAPLYRQDYAEYAGPYRNLGQGKGPVRWVGMGEISEGATWFRPRIPSLEKLDLSGDVLLVLSPREARYLWNVKRQAVLVVADSPQTLRRGAVLSARDPTATLFGTGRQVGWEAPTLWISEALADRLLAPTGRTVADLRAMQAELGPDEVVTLDTGVEVAVAVEGTLHERVPARHVIGHLPGRSTDLNDRMIVVLAQYDGVGTGPDGTLYPGATDNASGVAAMLELVRSWEEANYQPYRSFLFVAYVGEATQHGQEPGSPLKVADFLKAKHGFSTSFDLEAVVFLRGLGGQGDALLLSSEGSLRLAELFGRAARQMHAPIRRAGEALDIGAFFTGRSFWAGGEEAPNLGLSWAGYGATSHQPTDTVDAVSAETLERAGKSISLALMVMGRELNY